MPTRVKNLLVEVERVQLHGIPQCPWTRFHPGFGHWSANLLGLERRLVRLQDDVIECVGIEYPEVVVVRPRQHVPAEGKIQPISQSSTAGKREDKSGDVVRKWCE